MLVRELIAQLSQFNQEANVLVCSGYLEDEKIIDDLREYPIFAVDDGGPRDNIAIWFTFPNNNMPKE